MRPKLRDSITSNMSRIGKELGNPSLYCEFKHFSSPVVTWAKRKALRKQLVQSLKRVAVLQNPLNVFPGVKSWENVRRGEEEWDQLLVPGSCPTHSWSTMSIAHCPLMGGFIFSLNINLCLGLDIEIADRVCLRTIHRIAKVKEIESAPHIALLWVAKEASFKCLRVDKGTIVPSQPHIFDWVKFDSAYLFSFSHKNQKGRGGAFRVEELAFAYAQIDNKS